MTGLVAGGLEDATRHFPAAPNNERPAMTTSSRQVEANCRNAKCSRGTRIRTLKSVSRLIAITYGLTSGTLSRPVEDPLEYEGRLDTWTTELARNPFKHELARRALSRSWRLDRADRIQQALVARRLAAGST